ncbi:hypothetical protein [Streptomyces sp. NPDC059262]|uniref:hypothetical protein n=1 Tax=Streptomyces sp. NPDC059262 TaxID=3346797 RepID=UPI00367C7635
MGLTSLLLIANALIRDQGRRFHTIEDIDDVTGTPECKAQGHPAEFDLTTDGLVTRRRRKAG